MFIHDLNEATAAALLPKLLPAAESRRLEFK